MVTYAELRLRVDRGVARSSYRVVASGPAGEAVGRFKLPFSELELENFILRVGSTRRGRRRIGSPEMELAKGFGSKLFGALFDGDIRELYRSSITEARSSARGLRVTLSLTGAPELLQVPWEYLYDHPSFLSISTWTPVVRYLDLPKPRRPLHVELPLRILAVVSAPVDYETLDVEQEQRKLETALAPLKAMGAIAIDWLEEPSLRSLQRQLRRGDYHVFHYIGHGGYDHEADDGVLLFEDDKSRGRLVSGIQLGTILADEISLRLAVLNACEGGRTSLQDPYSGVATSLIEREIPAVIGMQFEITDRAAIVFASEFYSALADGLPVDTAVAEARKAIYADENDIEWGTPVLFMRVADGRLFDVGAHVPVRPVAKATVPADDVLDAERERQEAERREAEAAAERERQEAERREREEAERREAEAAAERERAETAERERQEAEQREAEAAAKQERLEAERREREEAERREAEAAAERQRAEAAERERVEAERAAAAQREREEAERREAEAAAERQRAEAAERERQEAERRERERVEAERHEAEAAAELERLKAEWREAEAAAERERQEAERREREQQEGERRQRERQEAERREKAQRRERAAAVTAWVSEADVVAARQQADSQTIRASANEHDATAVPAWLPRAAGRAAIGAPLAAVAQTILYLLLGTDGSRVERGFIGYVTGLTITTVVAVVLAEGLKPALRHPHGEAYRRLGANRLAAAGVEGALAGVTVGLVALGASGLLSAPAVLVSPAVTAAAFMAAEAWMDRVTGSQATGEPSS